jgi:hypothetical protein
MGTVEKTNALMSCGNSDKGQSFVTVDDILRDLYTSSEARESALNAAIVQATSAKASKSILRSSRPFTPMISR